MLALLFPGQGSQVVGMATDLRARWAQAQAVFDLADRLTSQPIARLCTEGPIEQLTATEVAQPAVVTTSLAALSVLRAELTLEPAAVAGHSVGELAAYVAAGAFDAEAGLRLVSIRARAMAAACAAVDGSMAAVMGLGPQVLRAACAAASRDGSTVELANLNAPGQLVVSGARDALERLGERVTAAGARRFMLLKVGGPFHSTYMHPAAEVLACALAEFPPRRSDVPVVLNASAVPSQDPTALRQELAVQVYSPVRWSETLQQLAAMGCNRFLEVGPGQVMSGLVRRTLPGMAVATFGSVADLDAARALIEH